MDRFHQLEDLRRSITMLAPAAPAGLSREEAMALIAELQEAERRLERLREGLERLLEEDAGN